MNNDAGNGGVLDWALLPNKAPTPAAVREDSPAEIRLWLMALRSLLLVLTGVVDAAELDELTGIAEEVSLGAAVVEVVTDGERSEDGAASATDTVSAPDAEDVDDPERLISEEFPLLLLVVFSVLFGDKLARLVVLVLVDDCEEKWYICICTR